MTPAVISVLTKGLTCGVTSACEGGTTMTAGLFTLWCGPVEAPPPPPTSGGGPAFPNALSGGVPNNMPTLNYPNSPPDLVYIDPNKVMGRRIPVKMNFKMGEYKVEKIYTVSTSKADVLISVMNFVTSSKKKMNVSMMNLKRKTDKLSIIYKRGRSFISKRRDFDE